MAKEGHLMPCKIHHIGSAPVSVYFNATKILYDDGKTATATFRGKLLNGCHVDFPPNYSLCLTEECSNNVEESVGEKTYRILGPVEKLVYWNYDCLPSAKDSVSKAINWLKIAEKFSKND